MYNIGLIVGNVEDDFSNRICAGAMKMAQQTGDNLFIFPVKYLNFSDEILHSERQKYEYQYNFLMAYAQSKSIDIVILCLGVISYRTSREEYLKVLKSFVDVPVLLVASEEEGYPSVMFDNVAGLREGIQYLISDRGCKNICMFTGNRDNSDAIERMQVYKQVLAENHLPQTENMIAYGDFSYWCTKEAEELFEKNPHMDAVVCGNDLMAIAMYNTLKKRNLQIGKDVYVLGFDDIEEAADMEPPLATIRADASVMGERAVLEAHSLVETYKKEGLKTIPVRKSRVSTKFINRESASGVSEIQNIDLEAMKTYCNSKVQNMIEGNHRLNILTRDMLMYCDTSKGRFFDFLDACQIENMTRCYLFMLDSSKAYYPKGDFKIVDKLYLQAYKREAKVQEFARGEKNILLSELYSGEYFKERPKSYVVIDIYSREMQHGIMICDIPYEQFLYVENLCFQISIATKIIDLLQVQEQLLAEKEVMVQKLAQENLILDNISNKDELTGINNRRGFITNTMDKLKNEMYLGKKAAIIYSDLNYLKLINDRYSHAEGNFALQACAQVLDSIKGEDCVAGRLGGDEFALFCVLKDGVDGATIKAQLKQKLKEINEKSNKPYEIAMSIGVYEFWIDKASDLKELLKEADAMSYVEKKAKRPFIERIV